MSAHPLNKECVYCVKHANECKGRAACTGCFAARFGVDFLPSQYSAWQARTEENVQEELTRAINAQDDYVRVEQLTWEFIKANPTALFDQARATVEAFIV